MDFIDYREQAHYPSPSRRRCGAHAVKSVTLVIMAFLPGMTVLAAS